MAAMFKKLFDFKGVSNRQEFWITVVALLAVYFLLLPLVGAISFYSLALDIKPLSAVLLLVSFLFGSVAPLILALAAAAVFARRIRDAKISKIAFIASVFLSPVFSLGVLMALPRGVQDFLRVTGREHLMLGSILLLLFISGLPFIAVGLFPSKKSGE